MSWILVLGYSILKFLPIHQKSLLVYFCAVLDTFSLIFLQSMSINEFLKPAEGELHVAGRGRGGRGRGRGGRGEFRGEFLGRRRQVEADPAPSFEDPNQFPVLGGAAVA